jgi:CHAD domain-containing protein
MILLEERLVTGTEPRKDLHQALEELLKRRWSSYGKALKRCRKKFSKKPVHALRVEIRRMQSTLSLLSAALPPDLILPLECELRDRIKALSRLRDTHIQIDATAEMLDAQPELKPFHGWLRRRERRLRKRLKRRLAEGRASRATPCLSRMRRALHDLSEYVEREQELEARLFRAVERTFVEVVRHYHHLASTNVAAVHRMRVAFKRFRYMAEALAGVVSDITGRQLRAMQVYQSRMGEIQDAEVLLKRAKKFAGKGKWDKGSFRAFRAKMLRRRARVTKAFLASADRLLTFWPPQSRQVPYGRRTNGTLHSPARYRR